MTRRDFEAIAAVLASREPAIGTRIAGNAADRAYFRGFNAARIDIGRAIADLLAESNERFDRSRFIAAAKLETIEESA